MSDHEQALLDAQDAAAWRSRLQALAFGVRMALTEEANLKREAREAVRARAEADRTYGLAVESADLDHLAYESALRSAWRAAQAAADAERNARQAWQEARRKRCAAQDKLRAEPGRRFRDPWADGLGRVAQADLPPAEEVAPPQAPPPPPSPLPLAIQVGDIVLYRATSAKKSPTAEGSVIWIGEGRARIRFLAGDQFQETHRDLADLTFVSRPSPVPPVAEPQPDLPPPLLHEQIAPSGLGHRHLADLLVRGQSCRLWLEATGRHVVYFDSLRFGNWAANDLAHDAYSPSPSDVAVAASVAAGYPLIDCLDSWPAIGGSSQLWGMALDCEDQHHPELWREQMLDSLLPQCLLAPCFKANIDMVGEVYARYSAGQPIPGLDMTELLQAISDHWQPELLRCPLPAWLPAPRPLAPPPTQAEREAAALHYAFCHVQGAEGRWARLRLTGANDSQLLDAIRRELGDAGGAGGPHIASVEWRGGKSPWIKIGDQKPIKGKALLATARKLFSIPKSVE